MKVNPEMQRILVIDDEGVVCRSCARIIGAKGCEVDTCEDPQRGFDKAVTGNYDLILLDIVMPEMDGIEVLQRLKEAGVTSEVVMMTGYATVKTAVEAMKHGAADYIGKPFTPEELSIVVKKVAERSALIKENLALRSELRVAKGFEGIIGDSRAMEQMFSLIKRVAPSDGTVLITGQSGTGKELVARAIHRLSGRSDKPFIACDCTTLSPTLLESELFGHVKGSFTGAEVTKRGLFEAADGGTLFLDEISNISHEIQGKLLRVLETRKIRKVGDTTERKVDIRLIAATNCDLLRASEDGDFRMDLYYRLNVLPVVLPSLAERLSDIPHLATSFLERNRAKNPEVNAEGFTPEALAMLESYHWPGNVRELKNIVDRLAILVNSPRIEPQHLPPELRTVRIKSESIVIPSSWEEFKRVKREVRDAAVVDLEQQFLRKALEEAGGNVTKAAEAVGMQRTNFHSLLSKHGLSAN